MTAETIDSLIDKATAAFRAETKAKDKADAAAKAEARRAERDAE